MNLAILFLGTLVAVCYAEKHCDTCGTSAFKGFGGEPSKCGCCPWPCCCKCFEESDDSEVVCQSLLDLSFIIDSSGSIGEGDWFVAKQFVADVTTSLTSIGTDQRVAVVVFSNNATLEWNLDSVQTSDPTILEDSINGLELVGGFTNTVEGMEVAVEQVFGSPADDPLRPNVAVVITDGRSNFRPDELPGMAAKLQSVASVITIGVTTEIEMDELITISGDASKVFAVDDFAALQEILKSLQREICPEPDKSEKCFCCCTPEQFFGGGGAYYY